MLSRFEGLTPDVLQDLFDSLPDTMFFVKDREGRYVAVNRTLVERSGKRRKEDLLGRTASEIFPDVLGYHHTEQDLQVIARGEPIQDRLEMYHLPRPAGLAVAWCLTHKFPVRDASGATTGVAGVSRDLPRPDERSVMYRQLELVAAHVRENHGEALRIPDLARLAGLSEDQLERGARQVFGLTPKQLVMKVRLEAASRLLRTSRATVSEVAHACGYADHSAFTRQFRRVVGLTPTRYRELHGAEAAERT